MRDFCNEIIVHFPLLSFAYIFQFFFSQIYFSGILELPREVQEYMFFSNDSLSQMQFHKQNDTGMQSIQHVPLHPIIMLWAK